MRAEEYRLELVTSHGVHLILPFHHRKCTENVANQATMSLSKCPEFLLEVSYTGIQHVGDWPHLLKLQTHRENVSAHHKSHW